MKLVLDTNAYCLCDIGHEEALKTLENASALYLPAIVYGELYYGFKYGNRFQTNLEHLEKFIQLFGVNILSVDVTVAKHFGDIFSGLRKKGKPIPTNDIWIAACCLSVSGNLLTADKHFLEVDQIQVKFLEDGY